MRHLLILKAARVICVATVVVLCVAGVGRAASITITNPSFEAVVVPLGQATSLTPGWTQLGNAFTVHPSTTQFPTGIPDGVNVAAVNFSTDFAAHISQTLAATLTADTQYTLQVDVGQRADIGLSGYLISFDAGGNLLAPPRPPSPGLVYSITSLLVTLPGQAIPISVEPCRSSWPTPSLPKPSSTMSCSTGQCKGLRLNREPGC
jgi:hypothetical protein